MDQITIKTPIPKCRLYWCLIEFLDWRYSQSCWYFRPFWWTSAPLTFSLVDPHPPTPLPVCVSTGVYTVFIQCVPERRGPQTDKHLPPNPCTVYRSIFKKRGPLSLYCSYLVHVFRSFCPLLVDRPAREYIDRGCSALVYSVIQQGITFLKPFLKGRINKLNILAVN